MRLDIDRAMTFARLGLMRGTLLAALCAFGNPVHAAREPLRPFTVEDLLHIEAVRPSEIAPQPTFSPDGQSLVFSTARSKALDPENWVGHGPYAGHMDIWLQTGPNVPPQQLTHGIQDGSGWFDPQWSPDGHRLLLKSIRNGAIRLYICDLKSRHLRQIEDEPVDVVSREHPSIWVDNEHIVFASRPAEESWVFTPQTQKLAPQEWAIAAQGRSTSASVLTAANAPGDRPDPALAPRLILLDLKSGTSTDLLQGDFNGFALSANRQWLAVNRSSGVQEPQGEVRWPEVPLSNEWVEVLDLNGHVILGREQTGPFSRFRSWSPAGTQLAYTLYDDSQYRKGTLYIAFPSGRTTTMVSPLGLQSVESSSVQWTSKGELIVQAQSVSHDRAVGEGRSDWYRIKADGSAFNLTAAAPVPPHSLVPMEGEQSLLGLVNGEAWQFREDGNFGKALSASAKFDGLTDAADGIETPIFYSAKNNDDEDKRYLIAPQTDTLVRLRTPDPDAVLEASSKVSGDDFFYAQTRRGTFLWRVSRDGQVHLLRSLNTWLQEIAQGEIKSVDYTSLNGEKLKAWVILPIQYVPGRRYPTVVWVYAGDVQGDRPPEYAHIQSTLSTNLQLFTSKGYAVVIPSMPLKPRGVAEDVLLTLPNGVMPAIDKVVSEGIADPDRLFVAGHSFGGFSTYGLVTQTDRFKAAIAIDGITDFKSLHGIADARIRFAGDHDKNWIFVLLASTESGQPSMGGAAPWQDLGRYLRNSPISYVDRVQTPLLMVHGDMDFLPMEQAEEFFASLYRQHKPAALVRYWGEEHLVSSPANVRDLWSRIYNWLDTYGDIARDERGELVFDGDTVKRKTSAGAQ